MRNCGVCAQPVRPEERLTNGQIVWHSYCFRCSHCGVNLDPRTTRVVGDRLFCPAHVVDPNTNPLNESLEDYVAGITHNKANLATTLLKHHEDYHHDEGSSEIKRIVDEFLQHPERRTLEVAHLDPFQIDFFRRQGFKVEMISEPPYKGGEEYWKISF